MSQFWGEGIYAKKGGWFIGMRWIAVGGGLTILLAGPFLFPLDIRVERLLGVLLAVGLLNSLYFWYWARLKRTGLPQGEWTRRAELFLHFQMGADLLALTLLLFWSGGSANPLIFFYLFHMAIGAVLFGRAQSLPYAAAALAAPWLLYGAPAFFGPSPHLWKGIADMQPEHQRAILWAYSLTAAVLWFFLSNLAADLREKEMELRDAGERLRTANEGLRALDLFKNRFLKQVVVQVKQPVMDVGLELGKVEKTLSPQEIQAHQAVETARKRIWALLQLIEDLVWLSRARVQDLPFKPEWVDVYEALRSRIQIQEAAAEAKQIHFRLHGDPLIRLRADRESFEKVADNLIANAVQYTPAGRGDILVEFKIEGDWLEMSVEDPGIGISLKNRENLFQEFYRGANAKKHEKFGTGLGLSIVKHILELHGGRVELRSEPQKGTRVDTWWPHAHEAPSPSAAEGGAP